MKIDFKKFHGTGNDFVVIDDRQGNNELSSREIQLICARHFGVGSDGLILIRSHAEADFEMVFYNPDGSKSFCGNGSRCALAYTLALGLWKDHTRFITTDGLHEGRTHSLGVSVSLHPVEKIEVWPEGIFLNTGSPHLVVFVENVDDIDVFREGRRLRKLPKMDRMGGVNVNFVEKGENSLRVRTYERGVENETLSCGSGVTAVALAAAFTGADVQIARIDTRGGRLQVQYEFVGGTFKNIWLSGAAQEVFSGKLDTDELVRRS